jgi:hypothetical protein
MEFSFFDNYFLFYPGLSMYRHFRISHISYESISKFKLSNFIERLFFLNIIRIKFDVVYPRSWFDPCTEEVSILPYFI